MTNLSELGQRDERPVPVASKRRGPCGTPGRSLNKDQLRWQRLGKLAAHGMVGTKYVA